MNLKEIVLESGVKLPGRHDEDWKHADLSLISSNVYLASKKESGLDAKCQALLEQYKNDEEYNLIFVDGVLIKDSFNGFPFELSESKMNEKKRDRHSFVKKERLSFFEDLAFSNCESKLHIGFKKTLDKPLHFIWISTSSLQCSNVVLDIEIDKNVEVALRHTFLALDGIKKYFNNIKQHINVGESSKCVYEEGFFDSEGFNILETRIQQKKSSEFSSNQFSVGSLYSRSSLYIALEEEAAECHLKATYALRKNYVMDYFNFITHIAPETKSSQTYKGLLSDTATLIFNGEVYVGRDAFKAVSEQLNHNLALGDDVRVFSRPQLDIYCDEVQCGHGSAMGRLGEEEFFYICSRAISAAKAKKLMAMGFVLEVMSEYSDSFKKLINHHLEKGYWQ